MIAELDPGIRHPVAIQQAVHERLSEPLAHPDLDLSALARVPISILRSES